MHPIKDRLNRISPSFCSAKWLQVTLRLQNGHTHSCHHPVSHQVPFKELKKDPSALHNTQFKMNARKLMLEGKRPPECTYCWKVEDLPGDQSSDRYFKSADPWSEPYLKDVASLPWNSKVDPKYLEVSFSSICNFKCAYCVPEVSTAWMSEVKKYGPYPTSDFYGTLIFLKKEAALPLQKEKNPYIEAFWKWIPKIISELHVLRVTGGEPLLSKDCLDLFSFLQAHPNPRLNFSINTNLGVPTALVRSTVQKLHALKAEGQINSAGLYTSLDTWGEQAEYIRFGLDLNLWKNNLELCLLESSLVKTNIMVTFNALSVFNFRHFLNFVLDKKEKYSGRLGIDISILHSPPFLSLLILEPEQLQLIENDLAFMQLNSIEKKPFGFEHHEIEKMKRLVEFSRHSLTVAETKKRRINFVSYILEYDRRKKTNFLKIFPQMEATFKVWKVFYDNQNVIKKSVQEVLRVGQKWVGNQFIE